jgi:hypothetical protein
MTLSAPGEDATDRHSTGPGGDPDDAPAKF